MRRWYIPAVMRTHAILALLPLAGTTALSGRPADPVEVRVEMDRQVYQVGDSLQVRLVVRNRGIEPVRFEFATAQRYDFAVVDSTGTTVWRWSEGRVFAQEFGEELIPGGDEREFSEVITPDLAPGTYLLSGTLTAANGPRTDEATFVVE
jgi:hypothetical protein